MPNQTNRTTQTPGVGVLDDEHLLWIANRKMTVSGNQHNRKIEHSMNHAPED